MKRLYSIAFILACSSISYAQVASRLINSQAINPADSAVLNVLTVDTIPGLMNRITPVRTRSLRFDTKQVRGLKDSVALFTSGLYRPINYVPTSGQITTALGFTPYNSTNPNGYISSVPAQSFGSLTGRPTTLSGYGIVDAYPLSGNPSGFLTSFTETDPQFDTKFATKNTGGLTEGSNLYYTATRFNAAFSGKSTTDLLEGTNLYWTSARFNTAFSGKNTDGLAEGATNLYYSNTRARAAISLTTTGTGAATYNNTTGALNIPTPATAKRIVTYSGTSDANGAYSATFSPAFSVAPNIQANITNQSATNQFLRVTSVTTTGFTVNVFQRASLTVLGLELIAASVTNVSGAAIDVLVVEK